MTTTTRLMLQILAMDSTASLHLSTYTSMWFINSRISISDGVIRSGATEHRDTPEEAIEAFHQRLIEGVGVDQVIAVGDGEDRQHYRWNGAAFAHEPLSVMKAVWS